MPSLFRTLTGHKRTFAGMLTGCLAFLLLGLPLGLPLHGAARAVLAWDLGGFVFLLLCTLLFSMTPARLMPANADAQQEGEWTIFSVTLLGVAISFAAIVTGFSGTKDLPAHARAWHVGLVAATLLISWMVMQATFAMRYAHEYYTRTDGNRIDGGLQFPSSEDPDYWDFVYFSVVLGMTFQVSDVQIASRTLRRVATVHGFLGFLFNTVIIAVTVNISSGFLS